MISNWASSFSPNPLSFFSIEIYCQLAVSEEIFKIKNKIKFSHLHWEPPARKASVLTITLTLQEIVKGVKVRVTV